MHWKVLTGNYKDHEQLCNRETGEGETKHAKALACPPTHSSMGRNIFPTSGLFLVNENGGVQVTNDKWVEVEGGERT
jgi:hypothetical protein